MSGIVIVEEKTDVLEQYGEIPISFLVESELKVELLDQGLGGMLLKEVPVASPYWVDFDAEKGQGPERWRDRWNLDNWAVLSAFMDGVRVGGAVMAYDTEHVNRLEGRKDITVLWDLRIHPDYRRQGNGTRLIRECVEWSKRRQCKYMKIESHSNNVKACRFYAKHAVLGDLHRYRYDDLPGVAMLDWYVEL